MRWNLWLLVAAGLLLPGGALGMDLETPPHALGASPPTVMPSAPPNIPPERTVKPMASYKGDNATSRRATTALNLLESEGYANFTDFREDGSHFTARETQNGKTYKLVIDPDNMKVMKE